MKAIYAVFVMTVILAVMVVVSGCGLISTPASDTDLLKHFSIEQSGQTVKTSTGIITGWTMGQDTLTCDWPGVVGLPTQPGTPNFYWRYTVLVPNLHVGANTFNIYRQQPGSQPEKHTVVINYDPAQSLEGLPLVVASSDDYSVVINLQTGLPVAILTDVNNLVCTSGNVAYGRANGQMVKFDLGSLQITQSLGNNLRPYEFLADSRSLVCQDGSVYDTASGQLDSRFSGHTSIAFSPQKKYAVEHYPGFKSINLSTMAETPFDLQYSGNRPDLAVADDGTVVATDFSYATGHISVYKNGQILQYTKAIDFVGNPVIIGNFAYIGANGNHTFGESPTMFKVNLATGKVDQQKTNYGTKQFVSNGHILSLEDDSTPYFYYGTVMDSSLNRIGQSFSLPEKVNTASYNGN